MRTAKHCTWHNLPVMGTIDEVRVWTRELAPTEILARMRKPLQAQDETGLLFYFPFDDAGMEMGTNVVESKALPWWGILGTSMGVSRTMRRSPQRPRRRRPLACNAACTSCSRGTCSLSSVPAGSTMPHIPRRARRVPGAARTLA